MKFSNQIKKALEESGVHLRPGKLESVWLRAAAFESKLASATRSKTTLCLDSVVKAMAELNFAS
jgi:hypothetical protein